MIDQALPVQSAEPAHYPLAAAATLAVMATDGVSFGNSGGTITLLDPAGLKVHGCPTPPTGARTEGWTIVF